MQYVVDYPDFRLLFREIPTNPLDRTDDKQTAPIIQGSARKLDWPNTQMITFGIDAANCLQLDIELKKESKRSLQFKVSPEMQVNGLWTGFDNGTRSNGTHTIHRPIIEKSRSFEQDVLKCGVVNTPDMFDQNLGRVYGWSITGSERTFNVPIFLVETKKPANNTGLQWKDIAVPMSYMCQYYTPVGGAEKIVAVSPATTSTPGVDHKLELLISAMKESRDAAKQNQHDIKCLSNLVTVLQKDMMSFRMR